VPIEAGARLGPYTLLALRGRDGKGEVYRAHDTRSDRDVAIKILSPRYLDDPTLKKRLERELKAISQLEHPHVCTLHDVGSESGVDYLVTEYLDGVTLEDRLRRGPLTLPDVLRAGREIAEAMEAAHRRGIVHGDLEPGNVMLTEHGAKVLDFGLAKDVEVALAATATQAFMLSGPLTREGTLAGITPYTAPEQIEGRPADKRSDLWALGCVLYEMATGEQSFQGADQPSLIAAIMGSEPVPVSKRRPIAPERLDWLIGRCLAKSAERRWQSAGFLALELDAIDAERCCRS
jgi:serine/threonine protein kinase